MDKPWKAFERRVAKELGTQRRLKTGTGDKADIGDDDFPLCVDAKLSKNPQLQLWYHKLWDYAEGTGKEPVLVYRYPGRHRVYVFVAWEYIHSLLKGSGIEGEIRWLAIGVVRRWECKRWYKAAMKAAGEKIAGIKFVDNKGKEIAVIELHVFVSILKARGVICTRDEHREEGLERV